MAVAYVTLQAISILLATLDLLTTLSAAFVGFSLAFTSSQLLFRATREFGASKPSRFFGMFLLQASASASCQVLAFFISPLSREASLFVLLLGNFVLIFLLVSLTEVFAGRAFLSVPIWLIGTGGALAYALKSTGPLIVASLATPSFLFALCLLRYVNSFSSSLNIPRPTKMFRPYLEYKLGGKGDNLEALLKSTSRTSEVKLTAVCFERGKAPIFLINPGMHFGPFDRIGSASFPSDAYAAFRERLGAVALVTHPFSSHERDIVSKEDVKTVLERGLEELAKYSCHADVGMTPFFVASSGAFDVWVALCGDLAICIARTKDPKVDDLPESALGALLSESRRLGVENVYDIDAHNNISLPPPSKPRLARHDDLVKAYRRALGYALESLRFNVRLGYANVEVSERRDVGPLGVSALVFDFGTTKQALVVIDGNNMVEGLADAVAKRVKERGVSEVLVLTNDNHILTGIFDVEGGYYPVGAEGGETIAETAEQAVELALKDLSDCKVRVVKAEVGRVSMLGDGLCELLGVTVKALRRFKVSLVAYALFSLLLSALGAYASSR